MNPLQIVIVTASLLTAVLAVGVVRAVQALRALYPEPLHAVAPGQAIPSPDGARPTAAVLLDHRGTEVSDFLLPYELLAASGAFNVYAVAPEHRPASLTGGLDVVPHMSYAGFADLPGGRADLVVVPHMPDPAPAVVDWIRRQSDAGATMLSICTGAGVAAAAGVFDGRPATAHWGDLARFERRYPQVGWVRGVRFVDAGDVAASAGITSGIDATLHVIRRLAGSGAMRRAANAIGYSDLRYLDDPTIHQHRVALADLVAPLTAMFGRRPTVGVLLHEGVHETTVAAAMDTYGATFTGRMLTMSSDARPVRTRHGLMLLPRASSRAAVSRLLVPRTGATDPPVPAATYLPLDGPPYRAFQDALADLARHAGRPIARFAAKRLEYRPTNQQVRTTP